MASKSVRLKDDTAKLLKLARKKFLIENKTDKVTDDEAIKEALGVYVNGFTKTKHK